MGILGQYTCIYFINTSSTPTSSGIYLKCLSSPLFIWFLCFTKFLFNTVQLQWCHVQTLYRWCRKRRQHMVHGGRWRLTPQVVMTGSLKTLQHNWQQSFTDGCSAKTWGSYIQTSTIMWLLCLSADYCVYLLMPEHVTYMWWYVFVLADIPCPPPLHVERT